MQKSKKWNVIEVALLLMLAICLLTGAGALQKQDALERKMIRLHVIANSDSEEDQQIKLQVRDRILAFTQQTMQVAVDRKAANEALLAALPTIEKLAQDVLLENNCTDAVAVHLDSAEFPLKEYDGFRLPAGKYFALRVILGKGEGHNWWCVVYPPLCTTAAADLRETAIACGMEQEDVQFMQEENTEFKIKFRTVELWESLRQWLNK